MKHFQMASLFKGIQQKPQPLTIQERPTKKRQRQKKQPSKPEQKPEPKPKGKQKKQRIPVALREQVWLKQMGHSFQGKCPTTWCQNTITVFDFQSGHNIPESKGGPTTLENLIPLCGRCNLSMGNEFTFDEWCKKFQEPPKTVVEVKEPQKWYSCFC